MMNTPNLLGGPGGKGVIVGVGVGGTAVLVQVGVGVPLGGVGVKMGSEAADSGLYLSTQGRYSVYVWGVGVWVGVQGGTERGIVKLDEDALIDSLRLLQAAIKVPRPTIVLPRKRRRDQEGCCFCLRQVVSSVHSTCGSE